MTRLTSGIVRRYLLQPIGGLAVFRFLDCEVRHRGRRRGAMPVLLSGREPHHIAGTYLLDGPAVALSPSQPCADDQRLTERVRVPGGACARLESHACADHTGGRRCLKQRVDANRAGKMGGGCLIGWLGAVARDLQGGLLSSQVQRCLGATHAEDLALARRETTRHNRHGLMSRIDQCSGKT